MMEIKVEIKGLDRLSDALKMAPELTINEISKAVQKSALTVHSQAIRSAPVNKQTGGGNLRQNIKMEMRSRTRGEIISKAPYSIFVEGGTAPHEINIRNKKVLANKRTGQFFGTHVHHPGTRPNPFMRRALDSSYAKITEFFSTAIVNIFNSLK